MSIKYKWDKSKKYIISSNGDEMEWCYVEHWLNELQKENDKQEKLIQKIKTENENLKTQLEKLQAENEKLKVNLNTCKNDYWFMTNLLENYFPCLSQGEKDCIDRCIDRMKFRKPLFDILKECGE